MVVTYYPYSLRSTSDQRSAASRGRVGGGHVIEPPSHDGLAAALRVFHLEGDAVGLGQSEESMVRNARTVEKDILLSVGLDEAVVFFLVEPFDDAFAHLWSLLSENIGFASGHPRKKKGRATSDSAARVDANTVLSGNVIVFGRRFPERIREYPMPRFLKS